MFAWNLTAKTILSTQDWKTLFKECGFDGDIIGLFHEKIIFQSI